MIGFPFDSHVSYDEDGTPIYDRAITSEPYRKLLKELFKTGVMPTPSTNMQVVPGENMTVKINPGFAMVEGLMKLEEETRTLAVQGADTQYDRIDTVVLRLDDNDAVRICDFYIVKGVAAASPVHPDLTRTGSIYEIGLADLYITKDATEIPAYKITDTRYDTTRCGVVSSISEFDTTTLNAQMNSWSATQRANFLAWRATEEQSFSAWRSGQESTFESWESEQELDYETWSAAQKSIFDTWFDSIKNILDTNIAAHLQNEVDALDGRLETAEENIETLTGTTLTATLTAGDTTVTISDESISNTSMIDIYTSVYGVNPKTATVSTGSIELVFLAQQTDVSVKVVIK